MWRRSVGSNRLEWWSRVDREELRRIVNRKLGRLDLAMTTKVANDRKSGQR